MSSKQPIKTLIIYGLLCLYSFSLIKPVIPLLNDVIAHTFFKMQHLATVHFENGKYHVHQEVATEEAQQSNKPIGTSANSIYETLESHIATKSEAIQFLRLFISLIIFLPSEKHPTEAFTQKVTPPPQS